MRWLALLLLLAAPAAARGATPAASEFRARPVEGPLPVIRVAPVYALAARDGRRVSPADFAGRVRLETFIYTRCPDACPLVTAKLARLQRLLAARGLLGRSVILASITLDPQRDTPADLARYARATGADPRGWLYLRGDLAETRRLLHAYGGVSRPGQPLLHSDWIFLVDGENRVREIYSARLFDPERALADIIGLTELARGPQEAHHGPETPNGRSH